jgi:IclR family acetate operon transcriptional repressor
VRDKVTAPVEAIERALEILDAFSADTPELGVAEISRALELKRSTVHRALASLEAGGLLRQDHVTQKYTLGSKVLKYAHVMQSQHSLPAIALPVMKALRDRFNETVALHVLEGQGRVVVQQVESTHDLHRTYRDLGMALPLVAGSPGKVILAFMPPDQSRRIVGKQLQPLTENTIIDVHELLCQLDEIRRHGYATSVGEHSSGISSVSCPVMNQESRVVASVNISGPAERFARARALECLPFLKEATRYISRELGYAGPDIP